MQKHRRRHHLMKMKQWNFNPTAISCLFSSIFLLPPSRRRLTSADVCLLFTQSDFAFFSHFRDVFLCTSGSGACRWRIWRRESQQCSAWRSDETKWCCYVQRNRENLDVISHISRFDMIEICGRWAKTEDEQIEKNESTRHLGESTDDLAAISFEIGFVSQHFDLCNGCST